MRFIIAFNGLPGSGKTTIGQRLAKEIKAEFIESDRWKHQIARSILSPEEYRRITEKNLPYPEDVRRLIQARIYEEQVASCLRTVCVLEVCLPSVSARMDLVDFATSHGAKLCFVEVRCDPAVIENRLRARNPSIGFQAHLKTYHHLCRLWEPDDYAFHISDTTESDSSEWRHLLAAVQNLLSIV